MRLVALLCFGAIVAGCGAARGASESAGHRLRVLVFNIHAGKDAAGVDNLSRVAALVLETKADIALLQEVDRRTRRSALNDQPAALQRATRLHVAFGKTLDYDGGDYGIAILSRWPISAETLIHLPVDPPQQRAGGSMEPRGVLRAVLAAPFGSISVFNTHLDPSGDDHWRRQEADSLLRLVLREATAGTSFVLAGGDFNSTPESAVQGALREGGLLDAWPTCGRGPGLSYPAEAPVKRIDYLFLTDGIHCTSADVLSTPASDHRPLIVEVTLPASN
jgi:endonuclease/exonuclease/phosphatase family metal-dependent hydrolase